MKLRNRYGSVVRGIVAWAAWAAIMPLALAMQGQKASQAELDMATDLAHLHLTISPAAGPQGGCVAGYTFQAPHGGCLRQSTGSQSESRSCSAGYTGTQTRTRSRPVYTLQNGAVSYGSWGSWSGWAGACTVQTPPTPPGPGVGTTFSVLSGMICSSADAGYGVVSGPSDANRSTLINAYKTFSYYGRCPEPEGYTFWLTLWKQLADEYRSANPGATVSNAYEQAWEKASGVKAEFLNSAGGNKENTPAILSHINKLCQDSADSKYGRGKVTAIYVNKSGNKCTITKVN